MRFQGCRSGFRTGELRSTLRAIRRLRLVSNLCSAQEKISRWKSRPDRDNIYPRTTSRRFFRQFVRKLRSLQSFRCQLKGPRDHEGNWKTNHNQHYHQPDCPIWNLKERKDLRCDLHHQPCDDCVGDRNLVNVPSLQFSEEIPWIHSAHLDEALVTDRTLR